MARKKSGQQQKAIQEIWKERISTFYLLGFALFVSVLLLSTAENPKHWIEKDIVLQEVSLVQEARSSHYQLTDTAGNTYTLNSSNRYAKTLVLGEKYHIIHAHVHWNRIKYMTDGHTEYVSYHESLDDYQSRTIAGGLGVLASSCAIVATLRKAFKKIHKIQGKH